MYNRNNDKFSADVLKAEIARANELGKAIHGRELNPFDRASIEFVNQYKDAVEVQCQAPFICANFKVVVSGIGGRIPRL